MKKLFSVLLAAALLMTPALFGCAATQEEEPTPPEPAPPATIAGYETVTEEEISSYDPAAMRLFGRTYKLSGDLYLDNAATGFEVTFYGTKLDVLLSPSTSYLYLRYFVDGDAGTLKKAKSGRYKMAEGLEEGVHTVRVVKSTSSQNGTIRIREITTDGTFLRPKKTDAPHIEFVGDSITVGAGLFGKAGDNCTVDNSDAALSYAYLTATALGAACTSSFVATEGICVKAKQALSINMLEMYASRSSQSPAKYEDSVDYDIVVVALGTNDSFYMQTDRSYTQEQFTADYTELLTLIRSRNPDAKIVCIYGLMEMNKIIANGIQAAVADFAGASYLEVPRSDGGAALHPSQEGAKAQSEVLTAYLKTLL